MRDTLDEILRKGVRKGKLWLKNLQKADRKNKTEIIKRHFKISLDIIKKVAMIINCIIN